MGVARGMQLSSGELDVGNISECEMEECVVVCLA